MIETDRNKLEVLSQTGLEQFILQFFSSQSSRFVGPFIFSLWTKFIYNWKANNRDC